MLVWLPVTRLVFRVRVEGMDHIPRRGAAILAFNHISVLDGPCLAIETAYRRRRESSFLVASEVFDTRLAGSIMRWFDQIPVRRGKGDAGALDAAIAALGDGALLVLAPEGRVTVDDRLGELQRIRGGVARIALPAGVPVVPVGIWGTQARWPKSGLSLRNLRRPRLAIVAGEPIHPHGDAADPEDVDAFLARVREGIQEQMGRARTIAGDPA